MLWHLHFLIHSAQHFSAWVCMQGYGVVAPALGLNALRAAMARQLAVPNVVVNPFQMEKFLAGGYRACHSQ